jgi:hypothetical protein
VEVRNFNRAAYDVANFFETAGYLHRLGALQAESVWHTFGAMAQAYCMRLLMEQERRARRGDPEQEARRARSQGVGREDSQVRPS